MSKEGRASLTHSHLSELLFYQEGGREGVVSRESLFDLISLFCRRLGKQTAEATSRLGSTPHLGLRFPAPPPHTHSLHS